MISTYLFIWLSLILCVPKCMLLLLFYYSNCFIYKLQSRDEKDPTFPEFMKFANVNIRLFSLEALLSAWKGLVRVVRGTFIHRNNRLTMETGVWFCGGVVPQVALLEPFAVSPEIPAQLERLSSIVETHSSFRAMEISSCSCRLYLLLFPGSVLFSGADWSRFSWDMFRGVPSWNWTVLLGDVSETGEETSMELLGKTEDGLVTSTAVGLFSSAGGVTVDGLLVMLMTWSDTVTSLTVPLTSAAISDTTMCMLPSQFGTVFVARTEFAAPPFDCLTASSLLPASEWRFSVSGVRQPEVA